ncbi:MAG TPA: hypothetical protein PLK12_14805 [Prolixibacteraceae bacterium]|nr:hypothetical protein [Prolixibacteraceae bacterium]
MKKSGFIILPLFLTVLLIFSTVGFHIMTTFCAGCDETHSHITIVAEVESSCSCCDRDDATQHCCSDSDTPASAGHLPLSTFVHLSFDSPAAKIQHPSFDAPILLLSVLPVLFHIRFGSDFATDTDHEPFLPPATGRYLQILFGVFRN